MWQIYLQPETLLFFQVLILLSLSHYYVNSADECTFQLLLLLSGVRLSCEKFIFSFQPLDRDKPDGRPQWKFTVFAQDEGGQGLVGYADIQVNVKDINDNAPSFPKTTYFGNVTENGTAGMFVMSMTAVDYDDPDEGTNAKLTYTIEKNVIEEEAGVPIFEIEPDTGIIKTAVCCLDREKTTDYAIQVVAIDGGGLKGTGTASIKIQDVNDMSPHFTKKEWFCEVEETDSRNIPEEPILTVSVRDEDETNDFVYEIIENSGYGSDKFIIISNSDGSGSIKIVKDLDYEDLMQRHGFRFKIRVSDKGHNADSDIYHTDYSWVSVRLLDVNDNKPQFENDNVEVFVNENAEIGTTVGNFQALDADNGGKSKIKYVIDRATDRRKQFSINNEGAVLIQRQLDRENHAKHQIRILAIDDGMPAKTSSATLMVIVQDVNDNAPRLIEDYQPVILEHIPPTKVAEIFATDDDDKLKSNGPPFSFRIDPNASSIIHASFKVECEQTATQGDGMAVLSSLRSFDRELQKQYIIPIIIKDSGNPPMSGTSTLTITIGDINDNMMLPGSKDIYVYNFMGQAPDTEIGRVYVYDLDDWDLPDKTFHWETTEHPLFQLNPSTGMITMREGTPNGRYKLKFRVYDHKHNQADIQANVTITVQNISEENVESSASVRIAGVSDEDFIRTWSDRTNTHTASKLSKLRDKVAELLNIHRETIIVYSVQLHSRSPSITDVRFTVNGSKKYKSFVLNGLIAMHRNEIEKEVGINITMVGINECLHETYNCEGSCTNNVSVDKGLHLVNANRTALVGVKVHVMPECTCAVHKFILTDKCHENFCFNGGRCIDTRFGPKCSCSSEFNGPRCQQTSRNFQGNSWAWYPALEVCGSSHLSLEFRTKYKAGLLLYNGPLTSPDGNETLLSDFISLELVDGMPRLLIDFGSGTLELKIITRKELNDEEWHRIDIFWDTESVRMVLDFCKFADITEQEDGSLSKFDYTICQAEGVVPPFSEYLNVNDPLQIGGCHRQEFDPQMFHWHGAPFTKSFSGCIRNIYYNRQFQKLMLVDRPYAGVMQQTKVNISLMRSFLKITDGHQQVMNAGYCWQFSSESGFPTPYVSKISGNKDVDFYISFLSTSQYQGQIFKIYSKNAEDYVGNVFGDQLYGVSDRKTESLKGIQAGRVTDFSLCQSLIFSLKHPTTKCFSYVANMANLFISTNISGFYQNAASLHHSDLQVDFSHLLFAFILGYSSHEMSDCSLFGSLNGENLILKSKEFAKYRINQWDLYQIFTLVTHNQLPKQCKIYDLLDLGSSGFSYSNRGNCPTQRHRSPCSIGHTGARCTGSVLPTSFAPGSYIKYVLSFEPNSFSTDLQLRFRTREINGELFRASDKHGHEYAVLEINDSKLHFYYNLNSLQPEEKDLWLSNITVSDGQWHTVKVTRYGSVSILILDDGEGLRYNESFKFSGHQLLVVDRQEGVYVGGKAEYTGVQTFEVHNDYQKGCMEDIKLEGKQLPLPPAVNGTQWGQATMSKNLGYKCFSNGPCINIVCPEPFICVDLWNEYECACGEGRTLSHDGNACIDHNECLNMPCLNGGTCINQEPDLRYSCVCPKKYGGVNCEMLQEELTIKLGTDAVVAFFVCIIVILLLILILIVYNAICKEDTQKKKEEGCVGENIIKYDDEGGGKDSMMESDVTNVQLDSKKSMDASTETLSKYPLDTEPHVRPSIEDSSYSNSQMASVDDLHNFIHEGSGSVAGSLSSLASGTEEGDQEFDFLSKWGPKFHKLAHSYRHKPTESEEEGQQEMFVDYQQKSLSNISYNS
ncbi:neural-cadherin-like [Schistocerca piceifrons]|uniref:neural-cadherin-like n=1 Tax=Schistocerca piceifrons TaxID=274613 RepID=UPI001F5EF446|nr:neural-cadherin-like [Schistocerca piceifrons]